MRLGVATADNGDLEGDAWDAEGRLAISQKAQSRLQRAAFTVRLGPDVVGAVSASGRPTVWKCACNRDALLTHALAALTLYTAGIHL